MLKNRWLKRKLALALCILLLAGMMPESILAGEAGENNIAAGTGAAYIEAEAGEVTEETADVSGNEEVREPVSDNKTAPDSGEEAHGDGSEDEASSEVEGVEKPSVVREEKPSEEPAGKTGETPEIPGVEKMAAEADEEGTAEEAAKGVATEVKIGTPDSFSGGPFTLSNNDKAWDDDWGDSRYAEFKDGILTLKDYYDSTGTEPFAEEKYAALYANGDLIIELDCSGYADQNWFEIEAPANDSLKETYGIYVNGDLTIRNKKGCNGDLDLSDGGGNGNHYVTEKSAGIYCTGTLTFEEQEGGKLEVWSNGTFVQGNSAELSGIYAEKGVVINGGTIKAVNPRTITGGINAGLRTGEGYGLTMNGGSLTVSGGDTGSDGYSLGIYLPKGELSLNSGDVTAYGGSAGNSYGAYTGSITAAGPGTLSANGGTAAYVSSGIFSPGKIYVGTGSGVTAVGGQANGSYGISCINNVIEVDGGTLTAIGGTSKGDSDGIGSGFSGDEGTLILKDGRVTAIGGTAGAYGDGIYVKALDIRGGSLKAVGGTCDGEEASRGIWIATETGYFSMSGGTVSATGGTAVENSIGVDCRVLELSGGSLTANGGESQKSSIGLMLKYEIDRSGGELTCNHVGEGEDVRLECRNTSEVYHGFYAYTDEEGHRVMEPMDRHAEEDNYGLDDDVYSYLDLARLACGWTSPTRISSPAVSYNQSASLNATLLKAFLNSDDDYVRTKLAGVREHFDLYAVSDRYYRQFVEEGKSWEQIPEADRILITDDDRQIRMTGNTDYNLCFIPKEGYTPRISLWSLSLSMNGLDVGETPLPGQTIQGQSYTFDFVTYPANTTENVRYIAFTTSGNNLSDLTDTESDAVTFDYGKKSGTIHMAKTGQVGILVVKESDLEDYRAGKLTASELREKKLSFLYTNIASGRKITANANGGKFVKLPGLSDEMMKTGKVFDIEEAMGKSADTLDFYVPENATYVDIFKAFYQALSKEDIYRDENNGIIRYGHVIDQDVPAGIILHSGDVTEADKAAFNQYDPFPQDKNTVYIAWKEGGDVSMTFRTAGGTVSWPAGTEITENKDGEKLNGYTRKAKENDCFTFPAVDKPGSELLGWRLWAKNQYMMADNKEYLIAKSGTRFLAAKSPVEYRAYYRVKDLALNSMAKVPAAVKAGDAIPQNSDSPEGDLIKTNDDNIVGLFRGFKAEPSDTAENLTGIFKNNSTVYACIKLIFGADRGMYSTDTGALNATMGSERLLTGNMEADSEGPKQCYIYKKYVIGAPSDQARLTFDIGTMGSLPDWAKDGVAFTLNGIETMEMLLSSVQLEELNNLRTRAEGKDYAIRWYSDRNYKNWLKDISDFNLAAQSDDCTIYGKWVEVPHVHRLIRVARVEPTKTVSGNIEYWYCEVCGKYYKDAEGKIEIELKDTILPATGPGGDDPEPGFTGTAMDTCITVTDGGEIYLVKGASYTLDSKYRWTSSNTKAVAVSKKYIIKAKAKAEGVTLTGKDVSGNEIHCKAYVAAPAMTVPTSGVIVGEAENITLSLGDHAKDYRVTWVSSKPDIAVISGNSSVKDKDVQISVVGAGKGTADITAWVNGKALTKKLKVVESKKPSEYSGTVTLVPLQSATIKIKGFNAGKAEWTSSLSLNEIKNKSGKTLYWQDSVVRVTKAGKLTAVGVGETKLTGKAGDTTKEFTVRVLPPARRSIYLQPKKSRAISIFGVKAKKVEWKSSDTGVVTEKAGKLTAGEKAGAAVVSGNYDPYRTEGISGNGFDYEIDVYVEKPEFKAESISGNVPEMTENKGKYTLKLTVGDTCRIKADGTYGKYLFRSSNNAVAFIDERGVVTARAAGATDRKGRTKPGKAKFTTKIAGKTYTINVEVSPAK